MNDKLFRQKIYEREDFDYDDRMRIGKKSDHKCCHCGVMKYPNYGAEMDHFIPISLGGSNRDINLVMLCEDCNEEKGNRIYNPDYLKYIKDEYKKEITEYFNSYIKSFEFFSRKNVLACDRYVFQYYPNNLRNPKNYKNWVKGAEIALNRVVGETLDKREYDEILDYYTRYLTKRNLLNDDFAAKDNIDFWLKFGCIYYIKNKDGIQNLFVISICKHEEYDKDDDCLYSLSIITMPRYESDRAVSFLYGICHRIPELILIEQDVPYLPVDVITFGDEPIIHKLAKAMRVEPYDNPDDTKSIHYYIGDTKDKDNHKLLSFFEKQDYIKDKMKDFIFKDQFTFSSCFWQMRMAFDMPENEVNEYLDLYKEKYGHDYNDIDVDMLKEMREKIEIEGER